ncbi:MAG: invasion associated locus B family protein [Pseudomonadota bacterium]
MTRPYNVFLAVFALALLALPVMTHAQTPKDLGQFGGWSTYSFQENGQNSCFMAAHPQKDEGAYKKRGDIIATITHRPAEKTRNTFSYATGYAYKVKSDVTVTIDGQKFTLFTDGETAWAPDQATDDALAKAIQQGSQMVVTGTSSRGTLTKDTFSLKGSGDAHAAISRACGL